RRTGPTGGDSREGRPAAAPHDPIDLIAVKECTASSALCCNAFGQHFNDGIELCARKLAIRVSPAYQFIQFVLAPRFACRRRNDLLGKHIERPRRNVQGVERAGADRMNECGAFDELIACRCEYPSLRKTIR